MNRLERRALESARRRGATAVFVREGLARSEREMMAYNGRNGLRTRSNAATNGDIRRVDCAAGATAP